MTEYIYNHLNHTKTKNFVSPYTGGGSVEFSLLEAGIISHLHINDKDYGLYALYLIIFNAPYLLIDLIRYKEITHMDFFYAQEQIKKDYQGLDLIDAAWSLLLVNRLAYSGIYKANPLGGKNGNIDSLLSGWNREGLIKLIEYLYTFKDSITLTNEDACDLIEEMYWDESSTIFIDPSYVNKGKALYHYYYEREDHLKLNHVLDTLFHGFPGADVLITYDKNKSLELYTCIRKLKQLDVYILFN
ncbi:DNA adenine methylase [Metabacillus fastidiosus]|uniref:DNA adenine methylase n=1 Tax=Metabacillus fastidiosus TaxID=1458 RepID=UPI003AF17E9A